MGFFYFTGNYLNNVYIIIHTGCIIASSIYMYNVGVLYNSMGMYNNKQCKILELSLINFYFFYLSIIHLMQVTCQTTCCQKHTIPKNKNNLS